MGKTIVMVMLALCINISIAADAQEWGVELSSAYVSEYADRGTTVAGQQIQSNVTLTNGAFSTGVTYALTLGDDRLVYADEIDINIDYGLDLRKGTTLNIGADLIHAPGAGGLFDFEAGDASTIEIYGSVSFDQALAPTLTALYDIHLKDFTLEVSASHALVLTGQSELTVELIGGFAEIAAGEDNLYLTAGAIYTHELSGNISAFASAYAGLSSEQTYTDAKFPAGMVPVIEARKSSAWVQIGLSTDF